MSENQYYLAKPGTEDVLGPMTQSEIQAALAAGSVTPDYVYCIIGMQEWRSVQELPGVTPAPAAKPAPRPKPQTATLSTGTKPTSKTAAPAIGSKLTAQPATASTETKPDNHMVFAILVTILCCLPFGIVAMVKASQVDALWAQGLHKEARLAADSANTWCKASLWSAVAATLLYVLLSIAGLQ